MIRSPARCIADILERRGIGSFSGKNKWSISVAIEPLNPPDVITIYDTGGTEPDTQELDLYGPTFQVRVRSTSYEEGYDAQARIMRALITGENVAFDIRFVLIVVATSIVCIGQDDGNRYLFTANYRATTQPKE